MDSQIKRLKQKKTIKKRKNNLHFYNYLRQINKFIYANINMHIHDLPDEPYRDMYDDGITAQIAANTIIHQYREFLY